MRECGILHTPNDNDRYEAQCNHCQQGCKPLDEHVIQVLHPLHIFRLDVPRVRGNDNEHDGREAQDEEVYAEFE